MKHYILPFQVLVDTADDRAEGADVPAHADGADLSDGDDDTSGSVIEDVLELEGGARAEDNTVIAPKAEDQPSTSTPKTNVGYLLFDMFSINIFP